MKKSPQPEELIKPSVADDAEATPMLPGTEQARSLGDMMREAEEAQTQAAKSSQVPAQPTADAGTGKKTGTNAASVDAGAGTSSGATGNIKSKRIKKVSRSQARRFARERALQALYQWDVSAGQSSDVRTQFLDDQDMSRVDVEYFTKLFNGVSHNPDAVDEAMSSSLDRPGADLDPIERAVLRIATYELTQCLDIPARVVINEGIEITKRFGADKGHTYVNGVLDKLANAVRPLEMKRR